MAEMVAVDAQGLLEGCLTEEELAEGGGRWQRHWERRRRCMLLACSAPLALLLLGLALFVHAGRPKPRPHTAESHFFIDTLPRESDFAHHIGSFCFGTTLAQQDSRVGSIVFEAALSHRARRNGTLYFAAFDDRDIHWGAVLKRWNESSIEEKVALANEVQHLRLEILPSGIGGVHWDVGITEKFVHQWHVLVLGVGMNPQDAPNYAYRVSAVSATAMFGQGEMGPQRCPSDTWANIQSTLWSWAAV